MSITKLLSKIDIEKITYQKVNDCITRCESKDGASEVTFVTQEIDAESLVDESCKIGLVIWVEQKDLEKAVLEFND